jgi:hypothetical protein
MKLILSPRSFRNLLLSGIPQRTTNSHQTMSHPAALEKYGGGARKTPNTNGKLGYSRAQSEVTDVRFVARGHSHENGRLL